MRERVFHFCKKSETLSHTNKKREAEVEVEVVGVERESSPTATFYLLFFSACKQIHHGALELSRAAAPLRRDSAIPSLQHEAPIRPSPIREATPHLRGGSSAEARSEQQQQRCALHGCCCLCLFRRLPRYVPLAQTAHLLGAARGRGSGDAFDEKQGTANDGQGEREAERE